VNKTLGDVSINLREAYTINVHEAFINDKHYLVSINDISLNDVTNYKWITWDGTEGQEKLVIAANNNIRENYKKPDPACTVDKKCEKSFEVTIHVKNSSIAQDAGVNQKFKITLVDNYAAITTDIRGQEK